MHLFVPVLALLSAIATALPTAEVKVIPRGAGGKISTARNFQGDSTYIPGNGYCTDLINLFGNYDGKVRSIQSLPGYQCQWYINRGCPADGVKLDFGSKDGYVSNGVLSPTFDFNIASVRCASKN